MYHIVFGTRGSRELRAQKLAVRRHWRSSWVHWIFFDPAPTIPMTPETRRMIVLCYHLIRVVNEAPPPFVAGILLVCKRALAGDTVKRSRAPLPHSRLPIPVILKVTGPVTGLLTLLALETRQMSMRQPGFRDYAALLYLAAAWGGSFLFIKFAIASMGPASISMYRIGLAALILLVVAKCQGCSLAFSAREWGWLTLMGVLGNSLPFTLINWGEHYVPAGLAAILMALTPLATMVMAHFFLTGDRLNRRKIIALMSGTTGILVLVGFDAVAGLGDAVVAQIAIMIAACSYAGSAVTARKVTAFKRSSLATGAVALGVSWVTILPVALIFESPFATMPTMTAIWSILYLAIFPTALAMILVLYLVERVGPAFLSLNNYMVPVFGVLYGVVFLDERLGANALISLVLILGGIFVAGRQQKGRSPK